MTLLYIQQIVIAYHLGMAVLAAAYTMYSCRFLLITVVNVFIPLVGMLIMHEWGRVSETETSVECTDFAATKAVEETGYI